MARGNGANPPLRSFKRALALLVFVVFFGALGYYYIETHLVETGVLEPIADPGRPHHFLEAIYWAIVSITTTGYGDIAPKTFAGQIFVTFFSILGLLTVAWAGANVVAFIVEGRLSQAVRERKMEKEIAKISGHFVICGLGRSGMEVVNRFRSSRREFVVIDLSREAMDKNLEESDLRIAGDCTEDEVLRAAQIGKARGLVAATPSDSVNVFTVLTAKELNPGLYIIARGEREATRSKLERAGANRVVLPSQIGGLRMATMALQPAVVDFLDQTFMVSPGREPLMIEEINVGADAEPLGKKLGDSHIKSRTGVLVLGVKSRERGLLLNPPIDYVIGEGDILIGMGRDSEFANLRAMMEK